MKSVIDILTKVGQYVYKNSIWLIPIAETVINSITKLIRRKKMNESLKAKVNAAAEKLDRIVNLNLIASKISNKPVRFVVSSFELVDGYVFKVALTEVIKLIPERGHGVVESWLDAFLADDYFLLVNATGEFLAELNLIPFVEDDDEKNVYVALLTALVRLIPRKTVPAVEG